MRFSPRLRPANASLRFPTPQEPRMSKQRDNEPGKSGYPETQPRREDGSEADPPAKAPRQPQNSPDSKPKPSS
jgi:hypothetical protein